MNEQRSILVHPLAAGERVGIETFPASQHVADPHVAAVRSQRGKHSDLVVLAVPAGEGVAVEWFLRRCFGGELIGETVEMPAKHREMEER